MKKIKQLFNILKKKFSKLFEKMPRMGFSFGKGANKTGIALIAVALVLGLAYYFKGLFIAAVVNGKPITRISVIQKLEKRDGKQVLENIITEVLITQEAKEMNVNVSAEEISSEVNRIKKDLSDSGQDLDTLLGFQGMSMDEFRKQVELQKTIEKILGDKVNVTDDEVNTYIEENKETLPENYDTAEMRDTIKLTLKQQKLSNEFQKWLDIAKTKSNINYLVKYL